MYDFFFEFLHLKLNNIEYSFIIYICIAYGNRSNMIWYKILTFSQSYPIFKSFRLFIQLNALLSLSTKQLRITQQITSVTEIYHRETI